VFLKSPTLRNLTNTIILGYSNSRSCWRSWPRFRSTHVEIGDVRSASATFGLSSMTSSSWDVGLVADCWSRWCSDVNRDQSGK